MKLKCSELIEILINYYIFCDSGFRIRIKNNGDLGDVTFSPKNLGLMDYYSEVQVRKFDIDESKISEVIVYLEGDKDDQT